jgi:hypothetical protein
LSRDPHIQNELLLILRPLLVGCMLLFCGCSPSYTHGSNEEISRKLVEMVGSRSGIADLRVAAEKHGWQIDENDIRRFEKGETTFLDGRQRECVGRGGYAVPVLIRLYSDPFRGSVDSIWLYDESGSLVRACASKTWNGT